MSHQVEELAALCGASWEYAKSEYVMRKILGRYCVSHEAIQELTNEAGTEIGRELEGSKIKELEGDKKAQGNYFEEMEVSENPPEHIYTDMDGVMINSRDNQKRMEGKAAVVWTGKELVKADTYALKDKRYTGSFADTERFNWDTVAEVYKRSGGNLDREGIIVRGDGAAFIRSFREYHLPESRYILDYYLFFLIRK